MKTVYKVVVTGFAHGQFLSAFANRYHIEKLNRCSKTQINPKIEATYRIGEKTVPPISGSYLYAFTTLPVAIIFRDAFGTHILKCLASTTRKKPYAVSLTDVEDFWVDRNNVSGGMALNDTVWCKWIVPIRLIVGAK